MLADLTTVAMRTALTGTASWLDVLVLCPGLHRQQAAPSLSEGECPATAAMTSGYVFRVENAATVVFLQKIGVTGHLTTVHVTAGEQKGGWLQGMLRTVYDGDDASAVAAVAYLTAVLLTLASGAWLVVFEDWWAVSFMGILVLARAVNVLIIRRRARTGWKGAPEPGVNSDLIILMTQDRWIRMRGATDNVKVVTSGNWMRDAGFWENSGEAMATLLVYLDVGLAVNATERGMAVLLILVFCSAGLLAIANHHTTILKMHGKVMKMEGEPRAYERRRVLADELIAETGRDDWALGLGMIVKEGATVKATM